MESVRELRVGIDVGFHQHRVGISGPDGAVLDEFDVSHTAVGFDQFFSRVGRQEKRLKLPVSVAMEGYNGYARPLDGQIQRRGYRLYNVNNLKLARFKEIFPGAAKSDVIDTRKILELFHLRAHLPLAKGVLQEVIAAPEVNAKLKRISRRRRELVEEKVRVMNRMGADLQAICPGLVVMTKQVDNRWFLRFLTCREDLRRLSRVHRRTLLAIRGIGPVYGAQIRRWQKSAEFAPEAAYVGPMVLSDAHRILELMEQIEALNKDLEGIARDSEIARRLQTIPGFGPTTAAELAGEIGTLERFEKEASLALYVGVAPLDNQSGNYQGTKRARQVNKRAKTSLKIALGRHIAFHPESRAYYERKRAEGKTYHQALRCLGRHLVRVLWSMIKNGRDYEIRSKKT